LKGDDPLIPVIGTIVNRLRKAIAIVEDGDTASQTIAKGKYIVWKGELCQTDSAITQGGTFATSGAGKNLTAKTEGLGGEIATLNSNITNNYIPKSDITYVTATMPSSPGHTYVAYPSGFDINTTLVIGVIIYYQNNLYYCNDSRITVMLTNSNGIDVYLNDSAFANCTVRVWLKKIAL